MTTREAAPLLLDRHRSDPLHVRAISDRVIDERGYGSFEAGDSETFFRLMRFDLEKMRPGTISGVKGLVTQSGGVVIPRYDVAGAPTPPPYARLDREVSTGRSKRTHYLYRPAHGVKSIDVHPLARRREISRAGDLYFCLEGSLKADAVLSAGLPAISSTSVTTWESADLKSMTKEVLQHAQTVYVVPDSDYLSSEKFDGYFNPLVLYFTRLAAQWLANRGVNAKIAVPWAREAANGGKLGADDFLARGYPLEGLTIEDPFPNALHLKPALKLTRNEERVLDWFLYYQGNRGAFKPHAVASDLSIDRQTVLRSYKRFEELGVMRVWEGKPVALDNGGGFRTAPHWFVQFELIHGYREYLQAIHVPLPVRQKVGMDGWVR